MLVLAERGTGASVNEMPEYWEAVRSYKKILDMEPPTGKDGIAPGVGDLHMIYLSLATLLHRNLQTEEAIHYHQKALAEEPDNDNTHMLFGYLLETSGMYEEAAAAYERALELNTFNLDAHSRIVTMRKYRSVDHPLFVKLRAAYENALQHAPDNVDVYDFTLAKAYRDAKDYQKSFYHLAKGNRLTKQKFGYDFLNHYNIASQMVQLFSPEVWVRCSSRWLGGMLLWLVVVLVLAGCVYTPTRLHTDMHTRTHTHTHTRAHTDTHTRTHTHARTHT